MTYKELVEKGGKNTYMTFIEYSKIGTPIDPEGKAQMWELDGEYYWIEDEKIITKMG